MIPRKPSFRGEASAAPKIGVNGAKNLPKLSLALNSQNRHHPDEFQEIFVSIVIDDPRLEQLAQQLVWCPRNNW